jgi:hypothetical protein
VLSICSRHLHDDVVNVAMSDGEEGGVPLFAELETIIIHDADYDSAAVFGALQKWQGYGHRLKMPQLPQRQSPCPRDVYESLLRNVMDATCRVQYTSCNI